MNQEKFLWDAGTEQEKNWKLADVDLVAVAEGFGCAAERVERADDIEIALAKAVGSGRPTLLDVRTDPAIACPPSWSPTAWSLRATSSPGSSSPMSHAFDPELDPIVEMLPTLAWDDPAVFRQQATEFAASWQRPETAVPVEVRDAAVPGPAGAPEVPVRIYVPKTGQDEGAYGALVYFHGGGWMGGDVAGNDGMTYTFAAESGAVVVSVDYRLAPENPFPAGLEDCFAAFLWTVENAAELGIDPERVAVGGDSAGANLAAGVSLMARDRGGPTPCFQFLRIPAVDDRLDTPSMAELTDTPIIKGSDLPIVWDSYLGGPGRRGGPDVSPYAAPARAEDLTGLPPAYVCVSEFDPLRDEGIAYAQRLVQAGVPTELHLFPGTFHGSFALPGAKISHRMNAEAITVIQRGLRLEELS